MSRSRTRLTGQLTSAESVIHSGRNIEPEDAPRFDVATRYPRLVEDLTGFESASLWPKKLKLALTALRSKNAGSCSLAHHPLLAGWKEPQRRSPPVVKALAQRPERGGVVLLRTGWTGGASGSDGRAVSGSKSSSPIAPRKIHSTLRGLARFWRCINPTCGKLLDSGVATCDACGAKALPLALCRTCGWDFYTGREEDYSGAATAIRPWLGRRSTKRTTYIYDPPGDVEVEPEDVPEEGEEGETANGEPAPEVPDVSHRVCPQCLLLTTATGFVPAGNPLGGEGYARDGNDYPVNSQWVWRVRCDAPVKAQRASSV